MMRRTRQGFTLLEVIVSITVASLTLAAGFAALSFVQERADATEEASRTAISGAAQRTTLVEWLENARVFAPIGELLTGPLPNFAGMPSEDPDVELDRLRMPTTARTPLGSGASVVTLYIDDDPLTPERGLVAEFTGSNATQQPQRMELVPQAGWMRIRYLPDADDAEWVDSWSGNFLPRGIEITLGAADGDSLPMMLRYPIRVAPGAVQ